MTNSERAAYIRGLMEGLELDPKAKETKVFNAMAELLQGLSDSVEELEEAFDYLAEEVDEIDADLGEIEEEVYGLDDDEVYHFSSDDDDEEMDMPVFEVTCPNCEQTFELDDEMFESDTFNCPNCGEAMEFDFDDIEEEGEESFDSGVH